MADELPIRVKKCLEILNKAATDTEKLAALFLVAKVVKLPECDLKCKKLILEAIGFPFLKRLLMTTDIPVDCPPVMYKSVALSVLSGFCSEPELATHPEIMSNIPIFLQIVEKADDAIDDNLMAINDAYECLHGIACTKVGLKTLFSYGAVNKMCDIYAQQSFQTDEALNILALLVHEFGFSSWGDNLRVIHSILSKIALDFETDHSERKFHLCNILFSILYNCMGKDMGPTMQDESWPQSIQKGLNDILSSKIGKEQRDPALKLTSLMVQICGMGWTITTGDKPHQFFLLLVQLCSVEIRMQLEDKDLTEIIKNADITTSCFIIIEMTMVFVAKDLVEFDQREKQSLYTALKGAYSAIIKTVSLCSKEFEKRKNDVPEDMKLFAASLVRALGAWLAQETTAMRNAVYEILPFMLSLANKAFYGYREEMIREKKEEEANPNGVQNRDEYKVKRDVDVLRFLLPAICHLTVEEQARKIMLNMRQEQVFYEALVFHWSNVEVKRPKISKAERLKMKCLPEPEYTPRQKFAMHDSRLAMVSLCNVFMNITVLEAKLVEESHVFASLLKFIFSVQPELKNQPENLVLYGNLSVLGLLVLKQQAKHMQKNDFAICRFIQATIRFLWDAYCIDETENSRTFSVSIRYKEHWTDLMELWFLGMQTLSGILALIPWVSEFAIESGWAEGIINMLLRVQMTNLPSNVKSAFEDFLCNLVDANKDVIEVMKSNDALTVCRAHRLMELGKRLFGD